MENQEGKSFLFFSICSVQNLKLEEAVLGWRIREQAGMG